MEENKNDTQESDLTETKVMLPKRKRLMSKQARNYLIYGILIAAVTAMTLYFLLKEDPRAVIKTISKAKILPILAIIGLVVCAFTTGGFVLMTITRIYNRKYYLHHGVINGLIGSFFSNITPFASGGQFVQVYTFTRQGVKAANAASILVMHFIVYQAALLLYGVVAFCCGYKTISNMGVANIFGLKIQPIALSIIGFVINSFTIGSLFVLAYCRPLHRIILNGGVNLLAKLHIVKDAEQKRNALTAQIATFRVEFKRLMTNFRVLITVFLLIIVKLTCLYSIPYFAGLATNVDMTGKYFSSLWSSSYLMMITSFIPIPGGSGGAEWGFQTLFLSIYGSASVTAACNILWRGISYYMMTLIGALVFIFYRGKPKVSTDKIADTQTFIDLNLTTFIHHRKKTNIETFEMLDKKYSRFDQKEKKKIKASSSDVILSNEEVIASFEKMADDLDKREDVVVEETSPTHELTKKYLKIAIDETTKIEESNHDVEVEKAIAEDKKKLEEMALQKQKKRELKASRKKHKEEEKE